MPDPSTRSLTPDEEAAVEDVLRRLRGHYPEGWPGNIEGQEHLLAQFAFYEGHADRDDCCQAILSEAAPFALGRELVARHGFRWVMVRSGRSWLYGVVHPGLGQPINLAALEDGSWNEEEYDQPPYPGKMTLDSLETIAERVGKLDGA